MDVRLWNSGAAKPGASGLHRVSVTRDFFDESFITPPNVNTRPVDRTVVESCQTRQTCNTYGSTSDYEVGLRLGLQNRAQFFDAVQNNICHKRNGKPIRTLVPGSTQIFELRNNGELYGAIQTGIHHFYIREKDKKDLWTSTARFTHLWIFEKDSWKLTEVLSYDHQSQTPPSGQEPEFP